MKDLNKLVRRFVRLTVGVIGDVMLDRYFFGDAERISSEAPTPIVLLKEEKVLPGGAANTAANIVSLGGRACLFGSAGKDRTGRELLGELKKRGIESTGVFLCASQPTIEKIRIHARSQQIARVDRETPFKFTSREESRLIESFQNRVKELDAVAVSDYLKGFITPFLGRTISELCRAYKKPLVVDAKPSHLDFFKGATLFTPNKKEAEEATGKKILIEEDIKMAGKILQERLEGNILITRGREGMTLFEGGEITYFPSVAREVFDVTGAGDTVVATMALGMASGLTLWESMKLANVAAGIVVAKRGTATVSSRELREEYIKHYSKN